MLQTEKEQTEAISQKKKTETTQASYNCMKGDNRVLRCGDYQSRPGVTQKKEVETDRKKSLQNKTEVEIAK